MGVIGIDALVAMTPSSVTWLGPADVGRWPARSVVIFAFLMSVGTTVIFGLAPALAVARASGGSFQMTLHRGGHRGHARLRSVLVVSQVAMAVVLLTGATLLLRSLVAMRSVDTGFDPTHVMTMRMSLVGPVRAIERPLAQLSDGITAINAARQPLAWVVRTQGAPDGAIAPIVAGLRRSSAGLPIARVRSMDDVLTQSVSGPAFNTVILSSFGSAALLLAIVGVYGLMSTRSSSEPRKLGSVLLSAPHRRPFNGSSRDRLRGWRWPAW